MKDTIPRHALDPDYKATQQQERLVLTERDSLRVLTYLPKPPAPNAKLLAAARRCRWCRR
jgi:uncharacterized protein (DUF1778 family)